jgi:hypothetical protein
VEKRGWWQEATRAKGRSNELLWYCHAAYRLGGFCYTHGVLVHVRCEAVSIGVTGGGR